MEGYEQRAYGDGAKCVPQARVGGHIDRPGVDEQHARRAQLHIATSNDYRSRVMFFIGSIAVDDGTTVLPPGRTRRENILSGVPISCSVLRRQLDHCWVFRRVCGGVVGTRSQPAHSRDIINIMLMCGRTC